MRATIKTLQAEDRTAELAGEEPQSALDNLEAAQVPPGPAKEDDLRARLNNATDEDLDACILHYAALSPDKTISRVQLRRQPAVAWIAAERKTITNKKALEDRLRDLIHVGLRRGRGKRPTSRRPA